MFLITGAAGKTGQAVIRSLKRRKQPVRAMVRDKTQSDRVLEAGAAEVIQGDMRSAEDMDRAMKNIGAVYHLAPNVSPHELEMGSLAMEAAAAQGVGIFVYHSVLHPQTEAMPHHWRKLRVEERLLESGLEFVILQPAAYMQNILGQWKSVAENGVFSVPYALSATISMVDLNDVAEAAAEALIRPTLINGTYELAGPEALDQHQVAAHMANALGRPVEALRIATEDWEEESRENGLGEDQIKTLTAMFRYYDQSGMTGSSHVLASLLGRRPTDFEGFLRRTLQADDA